MSTSLLKKISALRAKAESSTHDGEKEAFMRKVQELMEKHSIQEFELADDPAELVQEDELGFISNYDIWQWKVSHALCALMGAKSYQSGTADRKSIYIVGTEAQKISVKVMWDYLKAAVYREARNLHGDNERNRRQIGYVLAGRIWGLKRERMESQTPTELKAGLIVVDQIQAFFDREHPDMASARSGRKIISPAAARAARGISLSSQIAGGKSAAPRRLT